jgi:uncharacterized protein with FMN-binding domain
MRITNTYALSAFAGVSLVGALAGCSSTTAPATGTSTAASTAASPAASPAAANATYKDGSYSADGSYQSPAGTGLITVKLTLKDGVVTAITSDGHASDPTAKSYQKQFDDGIAGKVVGQKIDSLNVTKVSGSSLTSGGFDDAIKKIETAASA